MRLIHHVDKKTIINAGKIFRTGIYKNNTNNTNNKTVQTGFTFIELIVTLAIISYLGSVSINYVQKIFYYHKTKLIQNKLSHFLPLAQTTALITKKKVSICFYDPNTQTCSKDLRKEIIIFYDSNENYLSHTINSTSVSSSSTPPLIPTEKIFYRTNLGLNSREKLILHQFSNSSVITYNFHNQTVNYPINTTISYTNMYYNLDIKINKTGRLAFDLSVIK